MRILYVSVHGILEYDEVRLFQDLGHEVFSVGSYFDGGAGDMFRLGLDLGAGHEQLRHAFFELGCSRELYGPRLTPAWLALFDVVVVMHDIDFVVRHWDVLQGRPVILRLIGQGIELIDPIAGQLRPHGLKIVRYSPNEMLSDVWVGEDAVIRFYKRPEEYGPWTGEDKRVLAFVNDYESRFPEDFATYSSIVDGLSPALGGRGNEGFYGSIGLVSHGEQQAMFCRCAAYLSCSTRNIPYTLSFIEAWISGIPVVVMDAGYNRSRFFELPSLINHGESGFICSTVADARATIERLQSDPQLGTRIGSAGRAAAIRYFGYDTIADQWRGLLNSV